MSENRSFRGRSVVWPVVLISLGIVFLLNNLGVVSWDVWFTIVQMWPILLVAIGIDLIFGRRSGVFAAITAVVILAMFAAAFWLVGVSGQVWGGDQVNHAIMQSIEDVESAEVDISINVGELYIEALPEDSHLLIDGEILIGEYENVKEKFRRVNETAVYTLSTQGQAYHPGWIFSDGNDSNKHWDLALNPDTPLDLRLDSGVGRTVVDLTGMTLESLEIDSGVGEVVVTLPDDGEYDVYVSGGVGQLTIRIPDEVGVRISLDTGLGDSNIRGDFDYHNGYYYSSEWDGADERVEIYLDGGVGSIRVEEID